jgi:hypothetical protein
MSLPILPFLLWACANTLGVYRKGKCAGNLMLLELKHCFTGLYITGLPSYTDGHQSSHEHVVWLDTTDQNFKKIKEMKRHT